MSKIRIFRALAYFLAAAGASAGTPAKISAEIDWEKHKIYLRADMQMGEHEISRGTGELRQKLRTVLLERLSNVVAREWQKIRASDAREKSEEMPDLAEYWSGLRLSSFQIAENKVSATMEVALRGRDSMLARLPLGFGTELTGREADGELSPAYEKRYGMGEFDASQLEPIKYTGLVVDARHLEFTPSLTINIMTSSGRMLYGIPLLARATAVKRGVSGFFKTESEGEARARAGNRPLKVSALDLAHSGGHSLVISEEDAAKLMAHAGSVENLRRARVVILVPAAKLREKL